MEVIEHTTIRARWEFLCEFYGAEGWSAWHAARRITFNGVRS